MGTFPKIVLSVVAVFLTAVILFISFLVYAFRFKKTEICTLDSPDGAYHLVLEQEGAPVFFSGVGGRIRVFNAEGDKLASQDIYVHNDGGSIDEDNIREIRWYDDRVEVKIRGFEESETTIYILSWD